jgi:hypothetical protein
MGIETGALSDSEGAFNRNSLASQTANAAASRE